MQMNHATLKEALQDLLIEFWHSVFKHGDWHDYDTANVREAVVNEFCEYTEAFIAGDIHGDHGQRKELLQVAVVAIKGYLRLSCLR